MRLTAAIAAAALLSCAKGAQTPPQLPARIIYAVEEAGLPRLYAVDETPGSKPVWLSAAGQRAAYVGGLGTTVQGEPLPASRTLQVVYGGVADDASLTSLRKINADGTTDVPLADLPAATWTAPAGAWQAQDGSILVQLSRLDGSGPALLSVRDGAASVLAEGRFLALSANRVAYLANAASGAALVGDVRSVGTDGSANLALGGGDGDDAFHGVSGSLLVFTAHSSKANPELRMQGIDGVSQLARAGSKGLLFAAKQGVVVAARGGQYEKVALDQHVTPLSLLSGSQVLSLLDDGRVAAFIKGAGVMLDGKVLDGWAADSVVAPHQYGDRLVYTLNNAQGSYLRSARLDGAGAAGLSEGHGQELLFTAELPGSRVLFYRTKATEPGGWLATVPVSGGSEAAIGDDLTGTRKAADQDFGGLTRAGRLVFEAELQEGAGPHLFVVEPGGEVRPLNAGPANSTLAAILE